MKEGYLALAGYNQDLGDKYILWERTVVRGHSWHHCDLSRGWSDWAAGDVPGKQDMLVNEAGLNMTFPWSVHALSFLSVHCLPHTFLPVAMSCLQFTCMPLPCLDRYWPFCSDCTLTWHCLGKCYEYWRLSSDAAFSGPLLISPSNPGHITWLTCASKRCRACFWHGSYCMLV